jgi:hypothetical protein
MVNLHGHGINVRLKGIGGIAEGRQLERPGGRLRPAAVDQAGDRARSCDSDEAAAV